LSETESLIHSIEELAGSVVRSSEILVSICRSIENEQVAIKRLLSDIAKSEEKTDVLFEIVAEKIMSVEFLNVNPDYLLDIAKDIDAMSDLIERAALLFQYLPKTSDQDLVMLMIDASSQIERIVLQVVECLTRLESGKESVDELSGILSEREKAVDALREEFNSRLVASETATIEQKIWLKEIFADFDQIADHGKDLGIMFRVVGAKLERQRNLALKHSVR